jgi:hypothetical protein
MPRYSVEITRDSIAPPSDVYPLLADIPGWATWVRAITDCAAEPYDPSQPGTGVVRRVTSFGFMVAREVILVDDPPNFHQYSVISGLPVKDYDGRVRIEPRDGGSRVIWGIAFNPVIPGTGKVIQLWLTPVIKMLANSLVKAADRAYDVGYTPPHGTSTH